MPEDQYLIGKKYDTKNGFKADLRYLANDYLCGHVNSAEGFSTFHWSLDGFVMGAHQGFDLVSPKNVSIEPNSIKHNLLIAWVREQHRVLSIREHQDAEKFVQIEKVLVASEI